MCLWFGAVIVTTQIKQTQTLPLTIFTQMLVVWQCDFQKMHWRKSAKRWEGHSYGCCPISCGSIVTCILHQIISLRKLHDHRPDNGIFLHALTEWPGLHPYIYLVLKWASNKINSWIFPTLLEAASDSECCQHPSHPQSQGQWGGTDFGTSSL